MLPNSPLFFSTLLRWTLNSTLFEDYIYAVIHTFICSSHIFPLILCVYIIFPFLPAFRYFTLDIIKMRLFLFLTKSASFQTLVFLFSLKRISIHLLAQMINLEELWPPFSLIYQLPMYYHNLSIFPSKYMRSVSTVVPVMVNLSLSRLCKSTKYFAHNPLLVFCFT